VSAGEYYGEPDYDYDEDPPGVPSDPGPPVEVDTWEKWERDWAMEIEGFLDGGEECKALSLVVAEMMEVHRKRVRALREKDRAEIKRLHNAWAEKENDYQTAINQYVSMTAERDRLKAEVVCAHCGEPKQCWCGLKP